VLRQYARGLVSFVVGQVSAMVAETESFG
jgi:hypothetical protein